MWDDPPRVIDHDGNWYVLYGNICMQLTESGKPLRYQPPQDAPSRPQEARGAPCDCCGDVAAYRVCGRCFEREGEAPRFLCACCASREATYRVCLPCFERGLLVTAPRYKVGAHVDMGGFTDGEVLTVDAEPRYSVQWPDGHVQRIKESTLSPHKPAPVVCAPDGTRCAWMADQPAGSVHVLGWLYCPGCGGKLTAGG